MKRIFQLLVIVSSLLILTACGDEDLPTVNSDEAIWDKKKASVSTLIANSYGTYVSSTQITKISIKVNVNLESEEKTHFGWQRADLTDKESANKLYMYFKRDEACIVTNAAKIKVKTCENMFNYMQELETIEGLGNLNTSEVTNMNSMFYRCSFLSEIDMRGWNTRKVNTMNQIFSGCWSLYKIRMGEDFVINDDVDTYYMLDQVGSSLPSYCLIYGATEQTREKMEQSSYNRRGKLIFKENE